MEFLGDAVLQLVVTEYLYSHFPQAKEGSMTKLRARLVSRDALKRYARALTLGDYLFMGRGEEASGGRERASTLADAFEAVIGAIYLDSDFASARDFILRHTENALTEVREAPVDINPKGQLQEMLQSIEAMSPTYEVLMAAGPEHEKTFEVEVRWNDMSLGKGRGRSKQAAEVEAARAALSAKVWVRKRRPRRAPIESKVASTD